MARKGQQQIEDLHRAARVGDLQRIGWRLDRGVLVDAVVEVGGRTALWWAAGAGEDEAVRLLLERGANVDHRNKSDWTPLMYAACKGHLEVASTLLAHGADAALKNWDEQTALLLALDHQAREPDGETPEERLQRRERHGLLIQRLTAAQPDGPAAVQRWQEAKEKGQRWWARSFRRLYHALETYPGTQLYQEVLEPFLPHALEAMRELQPYRRLNNPDNSYELDGDDLMQLYALHRVNDFLLLSFQPGEDVNREGPFQSEAYRDYMRGVGYSRLVDWQGPEITLHEYEQFFAALGFQGFGELEYSPFFHEIVEVVEDDAYAGRVQIEHVFWPGLPFGQLLFSRAGVRVRCSPTVMKKEIAERSPLYFTYWRWRREAEDLSRGWGHNSQWSTKPRRDYIEPDCFHYNVDGRYTLDEDFRQQQIEDDLEREQDALTLDEQIELLTHRCFVRTPIPDGASCPYANRYSEPRPNDFPRSSRLLE